MIRTDELRGIIAKNNLSQAKVAKGARDYVKNLLRKNEKGCFWQ